MPLYGAARSGAELLDLAGASAAPATAQQEAPVLQVTFPTLPNHFWTRARRDGAIRQAANSRTRSADAVPVVLARLAALGAAPAAYPGDRRRPAPLYLLVSITGPAGSGKGTSQAIGRQLIPHDPVRVAGPLPLGSGEGLAESFFTYITDPEDPRREESEFRQHLQRLRHGRRRPGTRAARRAAQDPPCCRPCGPDSRAKPSARPTPPTIDGGSVVAGSYSLGVTINASAATLRIPARRHRRGHPTADHLDLHHRSVDTRRSARLAGPRPHPATHRGSHRILPRRRPHTSVHLSPAVGQGRGAQR